jgi:hypothetical protein
MRSNIPWRRIAAFAFSWTLALTVALAAPDFAWSQCAKPGRAFGAGVAVPAAPQVIHMAVVADFDGDGLADYAGLDAVYSRRYETTGAKTRTVNVGVYLNRTPKGAPDKAVFAPPSVITVGEETHCYNCAEEADLQAADVNGDGAPDLVVSLSATDSVYVLLNKNDLSGGFQPAVQLPVGKNPVWVRVGDFDGDGFPDLVTVNLERVLSPGTDHWSLSFLHGSTDPDSKKRGSFKSHQDLDLADSDRLGPTDRNNDSPYELYETTVEVLRLRGGDVLATGDRVHGLRFWTVPGTTKLRELKTPSTGMGVGQAVFGVFDLDGDGFPELMGPGSLALTFDMFRAPDAASLAAANRALAALLASNEPAWGPLEHFRFADVDRDGAIDVMAVFRNVIVVGFGAGTRTAHPFADFAGNGVQYLQIFDVNPSGPAPAPGFTPAVFGDFNGDGFVDILAGQPDTRVARPSNLNVYYNLGFPQLKTPALETVTPSSQQEERQVHLSGSNFASAGRLAAIFHTAGAPESTVIVPLDKSAVLSDSDLEVLVPSLGDAVFWTAHGGAWGGRGTADVDVSLKNECSRTVEKRLRVEEDPSLH